MMTTTPKRPNNSGSWLISFPQSLLIESSVTLYDRSTEPTSTEIELVRSTCMLEQTADSPVLDLIQVNALD